MPGVWGDHLEIYTLSEIFNVEATVAVFNHHAEMTNIITLNFEAEDRLKRRWAEKQGWTDPKNVTHCQQTIQDYIRTHPSVEPLKTINELDDVIRLLFMVPVIIMCINTKLIKRS